MLIYVFFRKIDLLFLRASHTHMREGQKTGTEVVEKTCFRASDTQLRGPKVLKSNPSQNGNASVFRVFGKKSSKKYLELEKSRDRLVEL